MSQSEMSHEYEQQQYEYRETKNIKLNKEIAVPNLPRNCLGS